MNVEASRDARVAPIAGIDVPLRSPEEPMDTAAGECDLRLAAWSRDGKSEGIMTLSVAAGIKGHTYQAHEWPSTDVLVLIGDLTTTGDERATRQFMEECATILAPKYEGIILVPGILDSFMRACCVNNPKVLLGMVPAAVREKVTIVCEPSFTNSLDGYGSFHFEEFLPPYLSQVVPAASGVLRDLALVANERAFFDGPTALPSEPVALFTMLPPLGVRDQVLTRAQSMEEAMGTGNDLVIRDEEVMPLRPMSIGSEPFLSVMEEAMRGAIAAQVLFAAYPPGNFGVSRCYLTDNLYDGIGSDGTAAGGGTREMAGGVPFYVCNCNVYDGMPGRVAIRRPLIVEFTFHSRPAE